MAEEVKSEVKEEPPVKKNFFKSTSFKCIIVLLAIVLVCGILLTICNSIFYVSDEEKLTRSIKNIYGTEVEYENIYADDIDGIVLEYTSGSIDTTTLEVTDESGNTAEKDIVVFKILSYTTGEAINDYLIKATGTGGYSGGSVTCWIAFTMSDDYSAITGVRSVSIDSNVNQSYISKIKSKNLEYFSSSYDGNNFDSQTGTGASYSMGAITNAVNVAMEFIKNTVVGSADAYADFEYTDYIDKSSTSYKVDGGVVTYNIKTTANTPARAFTVTVEVADNAISSFEINVNGSTNDAYAAKMFDYNSMVGMGLDSLVALMDTAADGGILKTGATRSNSLCVQSALFAVANYDLCVSGGAE